MNGAAVPTVIVVMGVAGSGKSTVAQLLAARLGWPMAEAVTFHSPANVAKMAAGTPSPTSTAHYGCCSCGIGSTAPAQTW
jgi:cytidylate kinase